MIVDQRTERYSPSKGPNRNHSLSPALQRIAALPSYLDLPLVLTETLSNKVKTFRHSRSEAALRELVQGALPGEKAYAIRRVGHVNGRLHYKATTLSGTTYDVAVRSNGSKVLSVRNADSVCF